MSTGHLVISARGRVARISERLVTEIHEDAYKQNTVYCSWQEILASGEHTPADTPPAAAPAGPPPI